jgi:multicomponent Na+:H+ antiporter subunit C
MHVLLAIVIGGLFAAAVYLMLRRSLAKLIIGLSLLTSATNLLILTVGGLTRARPALVPVGATRPTAPFADPIPQALILTAIVIGFGVLAFMMALAYRTYDVVGSDNIDDMAATEVLGPPDDGAAITPALRLRPEVLRRANDMLIGQDQE